MKTEDIKRMALAYQAVTESKFVIPEEIPANERTAFHGAAAAAAKAGKSHFDFNGKKHPVTMDKGVAKSIADDVKEAASPADVAAYRKRMMQQAKDAVKQQKKDKKEANDLDADNAEKAIKHDCATHVTSEKFGAGTCISGMHTIEEQEDGTGIVTHYDVLFEHGIEEMVPVSELTVTKSESHMHAKKKMKEEVEEVQEGDRAAHYKGATPPEPMTKPEARSEKKMKDGHGEPEVNDTEEKGHIDAVEAGRVTKKAPARKGDNPASDKIEKPADTTKQGGFSEMVHSVAAAYRSMYEKKDEE